MANGGYAGVPIRLAWKPPSTASDSDEEEVDELATSPPPPQRGPPDIEDSSDDEPDVGFRRSNVQHQKQRPLTAEEQALAKVVRAGFGEELQKLLNGVKIVLRSHRGTFQFLIQSASKRNR
jgi:hypothetical protein